MQQSISKLCHSRILVVFAILSLVFLIRFLREEFMKNTIHNFFTGQGHAYSLARIRFRLFALLVYAFAVVYAAATLAATGHHTVAMIAVGVSILILSAVMAWSISDRIIAPQMQRAERAKQKERALLASIGEGVIAADAQGRAILVNAAAERMMGWKAEELIGKPLMDFIRIKDDKGRDIQQSKRPIQRAITSLKPFTTDTTSPLYYVRKDGSEFPAAITATPVIQDGELVGAIDIFRDITQEKEIDVAKSTFVSLASHQLRTPLTSIRWALETVQLEAGKTLTKDQQAFLDTALYSTKQLSGLVRELLNVSRIDTGRLSVNPEPTKLTRVVRDVLSDIDVERRHKSIRIIAKLSSAVPAISFDPILVRQVVLNFLTNALKYTPANSVVRVVCTREGKKVRFSVTDSGIGIPAAEQPQIFQRFFRASNARAHQEDGSGLGLYLAKMLVQLSGGDIGFTTQEGKGSTFWFTLPFKGSKKRVGKARLDVLRG